MLSKDPVPQLSLVAMFDEICRKRKVLTEGIENKFIDFVNISEEHRRRGNTASEESKRIHQQLLRANSEITNLQNKVKQAKNLLDNECVRRQKLEQERDILMSRMSLMRELVLAESTGVCDSTRRKMVELSRVAGEERKCSGRLSAITESAGFTLSAEDVSEMDYTEDDIEVSKLEVERGRGVKRVSDSCESDEDSLCDITPLQPKQKRPNKHRSPSSMRTGVEKLKDASCAVNSGAGQTDSVLVATTTVTVPNSGPMVAKSEIRLSGQNGVEKKDEVCVVENPVTPLIPSDKAALRAPRLIDRSFSEPPLPIDQKCSEYRTPVAAPASSTVGSMWDIKTMSGQRKKGIGGDFSTPVSARFSPGFRQFNSGSKGGAGSHCFFEKTVIKPETCLPCSKRIRFGRSALRCRECRATCHVACRDKVPVPCVPSGVAVTPTAPGVGGKGVSTIRQLADYAPVSRSASSAAGILMVPGLVQHCIQEIERRGLFEPGLYRVSGSDSEVKALKAAFLRGKGVPRLEHLDIHVVCGCLKDFLRSLAEPVITRTLWKSFVTAATTDDTAALYQAIHELPRPNRDTLAFVVIHLQRVAAIEENKMNLHNLGRVFGPTLIGYSLYDLDPSTMLAETEQQLLTMEKLLDVPVAYWEGIMRTSSQSEPLACGDKCSSVPPSEAGMRSSYKLRHLSYR